ncbi:hypothetical protein [Streptomyces sp. NPDC004435]|uniref:hypothetical protein n=1 Tax=Streptomyces sp. NPDC004435 TaxID=3364701 RepID=UPI0036CEC2E8
MSARRPVATLLALLLPTLLTPLLLAGPAHAGVADVTCPAGTDTVTYSPGVTLTPASIAITDTQNLGACVSSDPTITNGTTITSFTAVRSCLNLGAAGAGNLTITWNNASTSTLSLNFVTNTIGGSVVSTGTGSVIAGKFAGDAAVIVYTGPVVNLLDCVGPGITSRTGAVSLALTSL